LKPPDGASPPAEAIDGRSAALTLAPSLERSVRELAAKVNEQMHLLDDGSGAVRRRLVALLLDDTKRLASERLAIRARKFVEQKGRCAACDQPFDARRRPVAPRSDAPLKCSPCDRAARQRLAGRANDPAA
jgi:hypothetical protein